MPASRSGEYERRAFDQRCAKLYIKEQISTYEIASLLGCSQGRVAHALRRAGVQMRGFSQAVTLAKATP